MGATHVAPIFVCAHIPRWCTRVASMETVAIIPAAGSGTRLGLNTPKAFVDLAGRTILERSVAATLAADVDAVIIAVPRELENHARELFRAEPRVHTVIGGVERTESVRSALVSMPTRPQYVLVHDAARPLTPRPVFTRVLAALRAGHRNVVPVLPVSDTVRPLDANAEVVAPDAVRLASPVDRSALRAIQTPQGFVFEDLVEAHRACELMDASAKSRVTDDASLLEAIGIPTVGVEGSHEAFKITHPLDLELAQMLCQRKDRP